MSNVNSDETKRCPKCGQPLAGQSMGGLCPNCLVQVTFGEDSQVTGDKPPLPDKTVVIPKVPPSTLDPRPSTPSRIRYFGDYELLEEIARGGMGVVYKARQVSLNRVVAVKMILAGQLASEAKVKRFRTEAEAAANLQHPNIVAIHEVGMHEGQHYFSMDYVEGKNLAEVVRSGPLSARQAATFVKTMAEAIQYAHQRGIFHRDLKPSNVLIDTSEKPRITDFGLAKVAQQDSGLTQIGTVIGTPAYMSPEQAVGRHDQIGPPSDVYSLGAILYELLTGRPPFQAETFHDTLRQVVQNEPDSLRKLNSAVPIDLETICLKCLEKQPQRRYGSAQILADELERFLNGQAITACPPPRWRKLWIWSRHHPWAIAGSLSVLVLFLLSMTYGFWELNQYTLSLFSGGQKDDQTLTMREILESPDKLAGKSGGEAFLIVCGKLVKRLLDISCSLILLFGTSTLLVFVFVYRRLFGYHRAQWRLGLTTKGWTPKDYWKYGAAMVICGIIQIQDMIHSVIWKPFNGPAAGINLVISYLFLWVGFNVILLVYREVDTSYHCESLNWSDAADGRKTEKRRCLITFCLLCCLLVTLFVSELHYSILVSCVPGVFYGFVAEYFLCLPETRQKKIDVRVKLGAMAVGVVCVALGFIMPYLLMPFMISGPLGFGMGFNLANLLRLKSNANPQVPVITTMNESPH